MQNIRDEVRHEYEEVDRKPRWKSKTIAKKPFNVEQAEPEVYDAKERSRYDEYGTSDRNGKKNSNIPQNSTRKCADCKKPPQMQCLHCSKYVCMDCAQKHVALANEKIDVAQHVLNEKISTIDRLSAAAKERVTVERSRIINQADIEKEKAFAQIDQIVEQQKKQIQDKNVQLTELSLDEISSFIETMTNEMEYLNENNNQLFHIASTLPDIQVRQNNNRSRKKTYEEW